MKKTTETNEPKSFDTPDEPLSLKDAAELPFAAILLEDKPYIKNDAPPTATERWYVRAFTSSDFAGKLACEVLIFASDGVIERPSPVSGNPMQVHIRAKRFARSGEMIVNDRMMPAYQFCAEFTPDPRWKTASEWAADLKALAPYIERDRSQGIAEAADRAARESRVARMTEHSEDPVSSLSAGIAAGVAAALQKLGIRGVA